MIAWWAGELDRPDKADWFERKFGRRPDLLAEAWGRFQEFALSRAGDARRLARPA